MGIRKDSTITLKKQYILAKMGYRKDSIITLRISKDKKKKLNIMIKKKKEKNLSSFLTNHINNFINTKNPTS